MDILFGSCSKSECSDERNESSHKFNSTRDIGISREGDKVKICIHLVAFGETVILNLDNKATQELVDRLQNVLRD